MFTGIIETQGVLTSVEEAGGNRSFRIRSPLASKLKVDQSIAHDGVCLTVEKIKGKNYQVTAVAETLSKTTMAGWKIGRVINLERCLKMNGRLDGHFVQGHVDTTGTCISISSQEGSWVFGFSFPPSFASLMVEKGSIAVNGVSLTAFNLQKDQFQVAIIPYTYEHTNFSQLKTGDSVNLEFDLVGKYIQRELSLR